MICVSILKHSKLCRLAILPNRNLLSFTSYHYTKQLFNLNTSQAKNKSIAIFHKFSTSKDKQSEPLNNKLKQQEKKIRCKTEIQKQLLGYIQLALKNKSQLNFSHSLQYLRKALEILQISENTTLISHNIQFIIYVELSFLEANAGNRQRAQQLIQIANTLKPASAVNISGNQILTYYTLHFCYVQVGMYESAAACLDVVEDKIQSMRLQGMDISNYIVIYVNSTYKHAQLHFQLAQHNQFLKKWKKIRNHLRSSNPLNLRSLIAYTLMSCSSYAHQGRIEQCQQELRECVRIVKEIDEKGKKGLRGNLWFCGFVRQVTGELAEFGSGSGSNIRSLIQQLIQALKLPDQQIYPP